MTFRSFAERTGIVAQSTSATNFLRNLTDNSISDKREMVAEVSEGFAVARGRPLVEFANLSGQMC